MAHDASAVHSVSKFYLMNKMEKDSSSPQAPEEVSNTPLSAKEEENVIPDIVVPSPREKQHRPNTKKGIISAIQKLDNTISKSKLHRMKKAHLEEMLSELYSNGLESVFSQESAQLEEEIVYANIGTESQVENFLYASVVGICHSLEKLSQHFKHKLYGYHLDGWKKALEEKHVAATLKVALMDVFKEHYEAILPYLSSTNRVYSLLLFTCVSSVKRDVIQATPPQDIHHCRQSRIRKDATRAEFVPPANTTP